MKHFLVVHYLDPAGLPPYSFIMTIQVIQGDITQIKADAIVNAANSSLAGGGGVDGAIHRAGGPEILTECRQIIKEIGSCKGGRVVKTGAGRLNARYIFHTVGPVWHGGSEGERETLARCYKGALDLALELGCSSIAFPAISTGVFGFPKEEAVQIVREVLQGYAAQSTKLTVLLVNFDQKNHDLYREVFKNTEL